MIMPKRVEDYACEVSCQSKLMYQGHLGMYWYFWPYSRYLDLEKFSSLVVYFELSNRIRMHTSKRVTVWLQWCMLLRRYNNYREHHLGCRLHQHLRLGCSRGFWFRREGSPRDSVLAHDTPLGPAGSVPGPCQTQQQELPAVLESDWESIQ